MTTTTETANQDCSDYFEHFMCYTGGHFLPEDMQAKLKKAYFDGYDAGKEQQAKQEPVLFSLRWPGLKNINWRTTFPTHSGAKDYALKCKAGESIDVIPLYASPVQQSAASSVIAPMTLEQIAKRASLFGERWKAFIMEGKHPDFDPMTGEWDPVLDLGAVSDSRCTYFSNPSHPCNKCGNVHDGKENPAVPRIGKIMAGFEMLAQQSASGIAVRGDWQPLSHPGQINKGDRIRFSLGGTQAVAIMIAEAVLYPGSSREEIIYNTALNHYFITSMVLDGTSSHKHVEVFKSAARPEVE